MTTYYVRKSGDDTTGDGSSGTPWLTVSKALLASTSGDTIKIGDGVYQESTSGVGYFNVSRALTSALTIEAELGAAGDVQIQGATHATDNTLLRNGWLIFNYIKFTQRVATNTAAFTCRAVNNITTQVVFNHCTFTIVADGVTASFAFLSSPAGTFTHDGIIFNDCVFSVTDYASGAHKGIGLATGGGTISNITLNRCTATGSQGLYANGATLAINGGMYTGLAGCGIQIGFDAASGGAATTALITGARATADGGHACLIGNGAASCVVDGLLVVDCDDVALVVKENTGTEVKNCILHSGSTAALYCKAAVSAPCHNNTLIAWQGMCFEVGVNSVGGNKCQNISLTYNRMAAYGSAKLFDWGDAADDLGGGVCDFNQYRAAGSGRFGNVVDSLAVQTFAGLRTAWAGYGAGTNDSHSKTAGLAGVLGHLLIEDC